ncbi:uncharacterized protein LY79DRAFT_101079 [Colletotrichum navitas]|uniref:Uncharacterized protein n=1 Tax=Colletotrichum navitas TaxID=681940 RepID=A0AAD8V7S5_9PEZI|nr:uncharacterized protein LY79DRAFT_101079 [Colletotrichum navitas]KAK1595533.1 hypothetical protein LY79DRAFT_101079 [Colletotrichum navitas]
MFGYCAGVGATSENVDARTGCYEQVKNREVGGNVKGDHKDEELSYVCAGKTAEGGLTSLCLGHLELEPSRLVPYPNLKINLSQEKRQWGLIEGPWGPGPGGQKRLWLTKRWRKMPLHASLRLRQTRSLSRRVSAENANATTTCRETRKWAWP